jgi:hypothetical protein
MSFISHLFHNEKKTESVVLVDIGTNSVAGAYAHYREGELPVLLYSRRLSVEARENEPPEAAMLRALQTLGEALIREGAPELARVTGSGSIRAVLVSIDAPWQKASVRIEHLEQEDSFIFTKSLLTKMLEKKSAVTPGKMLADESVIGTILNGYETNDPYGEKAHRASVIILTSFIDENVANSVLSTFRGLYHTKRVLPIAGSSLHYQAMRQAFPHDHDMLIVDATGPATSIALMRKGFFVSIIDIADRTASDSWTSGVAKELIELSKNYPLPRTILLLAQESEIPSLQHMLDAAELGKLWLSDNPPKIVPVLASHIAGLVQQTYAAPSDLPLLLMALFYQHRAGSREA